MALTRNQGNLLAGRFSKPEPGTVMCILCAGALHLPSIHICQGCGADVPEVDACFFPDGGLACLLCSVSRLEQDEAAPADGLGDELQKGPWPLR